MKKCMCNRDGSQEAGSEVKREVMEAEWEEKNKMNRRTRKENM
jgi:hypothetical protein